MTCQVNPETLDPLFLNSFQFQIARLPGMTYFVQETEIPSVTLPNAGSATPFSNMKMPGDKIEFGDLTIKFLVDKKMKNWMAIFSWIQGMGFPENSEQYKNFINSGFVSTYASENDRMVSDASLVVLDSTNQPLKTFTMVDIFPVNLSGITFDATIPTAQQAVASATFAIQYMQVS